MPDVNINCPICGDPHVVAATDDQVRNGRAVVICPRLYRRYRLMNFQVDSRRNMLDVSSLAEQQKASLREEFGVRDFEKKFERWKNIAYPPIGLVDADYPSKIEEIINAHVMGDAYPAVTSACCLAERILNRLVLRCRKLLLSIRRAL